jgi:hypothetical protein
MEFTMDEMIEKILDSILNDSQESGQAKIKIDKKEGKKKRRTLFKGKTGVTRLAKKIAEMLDKGRFPNGKIYIKEVLDEFDLWPTPENKILVHMAVLALPDSYSENQEHEKENQGKTKSPPKSVCLFRDGKIVEVPIVTVKKSKSSTTVSFRNVPKI